MVGPITVIDNSPTEPHVHHCLHFKHGDTPRVWTCAAPRCLKVEVWMQCEVCTPPAPVKRTPTPWLRYVG